jgi:hypothetical protein
MERVRGWTNRLLDAYPRPIDPYVRLWLQLFVALAIILAALLIAAGLVRLIEWLVGPPSITLAHQ